MRDSIRACRGDRTGFAAARRDSIRALVPQLLAAQQAHDATRWDRAADRLAARWDAMYAAYIATARTADGRQRIEHFVATLMGEHGG